MNSFMKATIALVLLAGATGVATLPASTMATLSAYAVLLTGMLFLAAKAVQKKSTKPALQRITRQISNHPRPPQRY